MDDAAVLRLVVDAASPHVLRSDTRMVTAVGVTRAVGTAKEAWWQGEPKDLEKLLVAIDKVSAILRATKIHLRPTEAK